MSVALTLTDFPDQLSPMVVKELRQGLRTRVFGGVMLVLHVLLVLLTLISGAAENAQQAAGMFDGLITLVLCIILPLRAFSALTDEIRHNTLDMLVLTRLSAWRIVFGKWAALAAQSLLVAVSLLPYVIARYIFGGLELFDELMTLGLKWLISAVATAAVVCLSTQKQLWLRLLVLGIPLSFGGIGIFSFLVMRGLGGAGGGAVFFSNFTGGSSDFLSILGLTSWAVFFFLSVAATRIAPMASHLALLKRTVHLAALITALLSAWISGSFVTVLPVAMIIASLAAVDALAEHVCMVPSVLADFYRRGWPGRMAAWFLAPGWTTGLVYSLLLCALVVLPAAGMAGWHDASGVWFSCAMVWMIAALVQITPARRSTDLLGAFIAIWLLSSVAGSMVAMLAAPFSIASKTPWFMCALPNLAHAGVLLAPAADKDAMLLCGVLSSLLWPVLLGILACVAFWRTRGVRAEARRMAAGLH